MPDDYSREALEQLRVELTQILATKERVRDMLVHRHSHPFVIEVAEAEIKEANELLERYHQSYEKYLSNQ